MTVTAPPTLDPARLAAARLWAIGRLPYFASALFALRPVADPGSGAARTDRAWRLHLDPAVLDAWSVPETGAALVHHALHLLRDHAARAEAAGVTDATAARWNTACDAEINDDLAETGLTLPPGSVLPADLGQPPDLLAEVYYRAPHPPGAGGADCGGGAHGLHDESHGSGDGLPGGEVPGLSPLEAAGLRRRTAEAILQAAGKDPGSVPLGLRRWAGTVAQPTVDWRCELRATVRAAAATVAGRVDYHPGRRNRRAAALGAVVLPGLVRPVPEVAVVCDTSGSVNGEELAAACAEIDGIVAALATSSRWVPVLAVDAEVQAVSRVRRSGQASLAGGGGTDMGAGLAAAAALRPRPTVVVVLTDGWTPWPPAPPAGCLVVVGLVGAKAADPSTVPAWARVVRIDGAGR